MPLASVATSALPVALPGAVPALLPDWLSAQGLIDAFGAYAFWGVVAVIFAETGLLIGFFLPGDSLLFLTGLLIGTGVIAQPIWFACVVLVVAAFLGNLIGYWIGRKAGPSVFNRPNSRFFKQIYVDKTHAFFEKYGGRAIILARFVPIVRTFITVMAGVGQDGLPRVRALLRHRRGAVGRPGDPVGLLARQHPVRRGQHRGHPAGLRLRLGAADPL